MRARSISKRVAAVAMFGALGNVLALLSTILGNLHPQIAIDLSHIATIFSAYMLGPVDAALVGAVISLVPFVRFGLLGGLGPLAGSLIFPGKALTGLFTGILAKKTNHPFLALLLGYVPESLFTWASFKLWIPLMVPQASGWITDAVVYGILIKAWVEILFIGAASEILIPRVKGMISYGLVD